MSELPRSWTDIRRDWNVMTAYHRFEAVVAFLLTLVVAGVIVVALFRLASTVLDLLIVQALNPLDHAVFQLVFGEILTLLIALEFNHTLQYVITHRQGIVQARVVVVIALLALSRKAIVTDLTVMSTSWLVGIAGVVVALSVAYWVLSAAAVTDSAGGDLQPR